MMMMMMMIMFNNGLPGELPDVMNLTDVVFFVLHIAE